MKNITKHPHFTVADCVILSWKNPIFSKMGKLYAPESHYFYHHFTEHCRKNNVSLIRTDFRWFDKKRQVFKKAWYYDKLLGWIRTQDIKVDIVHDLSANKDRLVKIKKYFGRKKMLAANPYALDQILTDKFKNYKKFKEFYPPTYQVNNSDQLAKAIEKLKSDKVVIKPKRGSSAKNVFILDKKQALKFELFDDALVQAFIDGKPVQDFRIVYCNGKYLHAYNRIAKRGSYLVNTSKGGKTYMLNKSDLPSSVKRKWSQLEPYFNQFPYSMLTVDFMLDQNGEAWLNEMNAKPGKVLYRLNGAHKAFDQIMKATLENYRIVYHLKNKK